MRVPFYGIPRLTLINGHEEKDRPWDASEYWIKYHIGQLKGIISDYKKDILVVQAGLIGSWGEWYYTESFGGGGDYRYINGNESAHAIDYTARKAVVDELLSAVPSNRQVALRTPQNPREAKLVFVPTAGPSLCIRNPVSVAVRPRLSRQSALQHCLRQHRCL